MAPAPIFQSLWLGPSLSPLEHACIKSFLAHGHRFVLYAYDAVDNVPLGCMIEDARAIVPQADVFDANAMGFSDLFRYELLSARGGWWVDTDVLCLTPQIPDARYVFAKDSDQWYNGAVFKAPPDSALLVHALSRARQAGTDVPLNAIGPYLLTELVHDLGLEGEARPREDFYPVSWDQVMDFLHPAKADAIEARAASSTFVHFCTSMLANANINKDVKPPAGSYLDRVYATYDIEFPAEPRYEWSQLEPQYKIQQTHWKLLDEVDALRAEVAQLRGQREAPMAERRSGRVSRALRQLKKRSTRR